MSEKQVSEPKFETSPEGKYLKVFYTTFAHKMGTEPQPAWVKEAIEAGKMTDLINTQDDIVQSGVDEFFKVETRNGTLKAIRGAYVVSEDGELSVVNEDIFERNYEPVRYPSEAAN